MKNLLLVITFIQLTLAKEVVKIAKSMSDDDLRKLQLGNNNISYQIVKATADSSDTPWDNPFEDNPENDNDTCDNPEGCEGGKP